ncbi:MAG TPA: hypothetical protein VK861_08025, partial [Bacteroidales bacterium]|nr:hypothetical protein [Bacteroidales bacterium]
MTFDERGHRVNTQIYGAFGGMENERPSGFIPTVEAFIGEGGSLENPRALHDLDNHLYAAHETVNGYEALGGIAFSEKTLLPGEHVFYSFVLGYGENAEDLEKTALHFLNQKNFNQSLEETKKYWRDKISVTYGTGDPSFNNWMKWVSFQPFLRRIYGCSFLPHHDYGKGGRGWRDLWQDCLALLIMDPKDVRKMLVDNYGGVRLDGTNATIIGYGPGEFIADRNNITRVWMDHGMWPLLTTNLYIQQTGDIEILLEETTYFHDMQICRGEKKDLKWDEKNQNRLMDKNGEVYYGTILEHILIEHLTAFYDVGAHGHMRLRGADWNDALDMASEKGESVAFTSMYAHNMDELSKLLVQLKKLGTKDVKIHEHLLMLLDDAEERSPSEKQELLVAYCMEEFSGRKVTVSVDALIENLKNKSLDLKKNIRENEWISNAEGFSWYNGYYDNHEKRVEGETDGGTRIMLTSQVFTVMSETADEKELNEIIRSADQYLYDPSVGGYRLNTDFKEVKMDLGRMFGFAYGHKENGAVFSHMAVMYGYALYSRGKSEEAHKVISSLYRHSSSFEKSRIYPGIPEYFDPEGRGMYHYLTGSASWLLLTVVTQMFGVRGKLGSLLFAPKLTKDQFDADGKAEITLPFHGRVFNITYLNPELKAAEAYKIKTVTLNQKPYSFDPKDPVIKMKDI